jgi:hypothetical protein
MKITSLTAGILALAGSMAAPVGSEAASLGIVFVSNGYRPSPYRAGYGRGYDDGMREGAHDGRRHEVFSYWDEKRYIHCGYQSSYGPRHVYQSAYRQGFEGGYRQAYYASYRCERHGRVACRQRGCEPAYGARYTHADDDWAYRDRGDDRHDEYRDER